MKRLRIALALMPSDHALVSFAAVLLSAADVSATIAHFIAFKLPWRSRAVGSSFASLRRSALIAVLAVKAIIHVAVEVAASVIPRAGSNEGASVKPFGTVVAVRGASVRIIVIVAIRAGRSDSDPDTDLSFCLGNACSENHRNTS
jgi:hypothetical protein